MYWKTADAARGVHPFHVGGSCALRAEHHEIVGEADRFDRWIERETFALWDDEVSLSGLERIKAFGESTTYLWGEGTFDFDGGDLPG